MRTAAPRFSRWFGILVTLAVLLPGGYYLARHQAWPAYKHWREARLAGLTRDFIAAGDFDRALLTARQALRNNQRSIELWQLAARAARAKDAPEAIYYQRNVARLSPTLDEQLELLRLEQRYGDLRDAVETIENIDPAAKRDAEFHRLAADVYRRLGRLPPAKLHLDSLISLVPDDGEAQLDLARLEVAEDTAGRNRDAREKLAALAEQPSLRRRALVALLADALARRSDADAVAFARRLRALPDLSGEDRVRVLAGLSRGDAAEADDYRRRLQAELAADPRGAEALVAFYRQADLRPEARRWFESLPRATREDAGVQEAIATTYLAWQDWPRLDRALNAGSWHERDFMREALLAYAARVNGHRAAAGNAWRLAVIQAGESIRHTSELLTLVARWGWQSEQYDLVWKLFALMPRNEAVSGQLLAWERQQGHTANLHRIFSRLAEFSGDDRMVKNNLAYCSLLLEANVPRALELARENFRADPHDPYFVTTYAFALYRQNQSAEALATLETLRPAALSAPERTMFHALFRAATGDADGAAELLAGLQTKGFLPEEQRLARQAAATVARLEGDHGEDARLRALTQGGIDPARGWLHLLPAAARAAATVEMRSADSLLALDDASGLAGLLKRRPWAGLEHIRLALTAYVARSRRDEGSARFYWRTAVADAGSDTAKLRALQALATQWAWPAERAEAQMRRFMLAPDDGPLFAELMAHFRAAGRTPELVAMLSAYLSAHPDDPARRCDLAYYSMLSGVDVARACVTAQEIYRAAPEESRRRVVYAFSLWKQRRQAEALDLLEPIDEKAGTVVPVALLRAAILADLDRRNDAAAALKRFDGNGALPEETRLAAILANKVKSDGRVSRAD